MIEYRKGNLFDHWRDGDAIIHIVNDEGKFGAGFTKFLSERLPWTKRLYEDWMRETGNGSAYHQSNKPMTKPDLGDISVAELHIHWRLLMREQQGIELTAEERGLAEHTVFVVNMVAQRGVRSRYNPKPIDYDALFLCLSKIPDYVSSSSRTIAPKIGTGLAGGDWDTIGKLIVEKLENYHVVIFTM